MAKEQTTTKCEHLFTWRERLQVLCYGRCPRLTDTLTRLHKANMQLTEELERTKTEGTEWFDEWEKEAKLHQKANATLNAAYTKIEELEAASPAELQQALDTANARLITAQADAERQARNIRRLQGEKTQLTAERDELQEQLATAERKRKKAQKHTRHLKSERGKRR